MLKAAPIADPLTVCLPRAVLAAPGQLCVLLRLLGAGFATHRLRGFTAVVFQAGPEQTDDGPI